MVDLTTVSSEPSPAHLLEVMKLSPTRLVICTVILVNFTGRQWKADSTATVTSPPGSPQTFVGHVLEKNNGMNGAVVPSGGAVTTITLATTTTRMTGSAAAMSRQKDCMAQKHTQRPPIEVLLQRLNTPAGTAHKDDVHAAIYYIKQSFNHHRSGLLRYGGM